MNQAKLKFTVLSNDYKNPLRIQCRLDGKIIYDQLVDQPSACEYEFEDDSDLHVLEFELKNKEIHHTVIDDQGNIVQDCLIMLQDIQIENINIDQLVYEKSQYEHDFNGSQPRQTVNFYGTLGCNGTVTLKFQSPVYLWLLENL